MDLSFSISLSLDNVSRCYFPGETLSGKVILHCGVEKPVESIYVTLVGKADVNFRAGNGRSRHCFWGKENIWNKVVTLLGNSEEIVNVGPGNVDFPFSVTLPGELPSSLCGLYGKITYYCVAGIKSPDCLSALFTGRSVFTVNGIVDLNKLPKAKIPVLVEGSRELNYCCWSIGSVKYMIKMLRSGFVPGENVAVHLEIDNQSGETVGSVIVLQQKMIFRGQRVFSLVDFGVHNKFASQPISTSLGTVVSCGEKMSRDINLFVRPIPPSGLNKSKIINVDYQLKITITPSDSEPIKYKIPIIIGNIPLRENFTLLGINPSPRATPNSVRPSAPAFGEYPDLPPPSYEEAMMQKSLTGHVNVVFDGEEVVTQSDSPDNFVPKYITY